MVSDRPQIDARTLADLAGPRTGPWIFAAIVDWAIIAAVFALVAHLDHPIAYALALVPLGSRQQALGALFHDAAHRLVARGGTVNDALGSALAAWPLGLTLGGYRRYHFAHHQALGTERDPEMLHKRAIPAWRLPASPALVVRSFVGDLLGGGLPHVAFAGTLTRPVSLLETLGIGAFWIAIFAVSYALGVLWIPLLWIAAVATVFWSGVRLRIWTEHLGTHGTHRITMPRWFSHLVMPHNIGLHWEHHNFPSVSFSNLPKLRAVLPGPQVPLDRLLRAFATSAPLASGSVGGTIDANGETAPLDDARAAAVEKHLSALRYLFHVALPIASGVLVYVGFRSELPASLAWLPRFAVLRGALPDSFVGVFPDAAWAYALGACLALVWRGSATWAARAWMLTAPIIAALWELGQRAGIVPGFFDPLDLVFSVVAALAAVVFCGSTRPWLTLARSKGS